MKFSACLAFLVNRNRCWVGKQLGSALDVLLRVSRIYSQVFGRGRHELHDTERASGTLNYVSLIVILLLATLLAMAWIMAGSILFALAALSIMLAIESLVAPKNVSPTSGVRTRESMLFSLALDSIRPISGVRKPGTFCISLLTVAGSTLFERVSLATPPAPAPATENPNACTHVSRTCVHG